MKTCRSENINKKPLTNYLETKFLEKDCKLIENVSKDLSFEMESMQTQSFVEDQFQFLVMRGVCRILISTHEKSSRSGYTSGCRVL